MFAFVRIGTFHVLDPFEMASACIDYGMSVCHRIFFVILLKNLSAETSHLTSVMTYVLFVDFEKNLSPESCHLGRVMSLFFVHFYKQTCHLNHG